MKETMKINRHDDPFIKFLLKRLSFLSLKLWMSFSETTKGTLIQYKHFSPQEKCFLETVQVRRIGTENK